MRVAVVAGPGDGCWLSELAEDGTGHGPVVRHDDLPAAVAGHERSGGVRWVWAATADIYPALLRAGVRVERCHDIALAEGLLLAREGRAGEPASLAGAWARLHGAAAPVVTGGRPAAALSPGQDALFDPADPVFPDPRAALGAVIEVHAGQQRRIAADEHPARFALLVA
ncbi:MAG TPA: bifunctional 3'-5' exonuclease/DNA polymerase, partial [Streptosporangiaceae bacterium]|nr:bifunctional 3'-5' exonuclease/DNA polymerase [Streptosporangiaceae bacterium]